MAKTESVALSPLGDRVVVFPLAKEESTASGILIPDSAKQERPEQGTVVAVGPGRYDDGDLLPMTVKIGDTVLLPKYGPVEVKINGKDYFIVSESDLLAIIT